jgi:hypothetical protein
MKTQKTGEMRHGKKGVYLHLLINQLLVELLPLTIRNRSTIINEVQTDLKIVTHVEKVTTILKEILSIVLSHSKDNSITVCAKMYSDLILVHVKDDNSMNSTDLVTGLKQVQTIAEEINGYLGITSDMIKFRTIAFTFPNQEKKGNGFVNLSENLAPDVKPID